MDTLRRTWKGSCTLPRTRTRPSWKLVIKRWTKRNERRCFCAPVTKKKRQFRRLLRHRRNGFAAQLQSAMTNVSIQNALECKISCSTSKVSYVLDTEDVFFRSHVHRVARRNPPRLQRRKRKKGSSKDKAVAVPQPAAKPLSRKEKLKAKSAKSKAQIEKFRAWIEKKTAEASDDDEEDEKKSAKKRHGRQRRKCERVGEIGKEGRWWSRSGTHGCGVTRTNSVKHK